MIRLGEAMMILELHRQGLSVTAIAHRTGRDPKTVRKYIENQEEHHRSMDSKQEFELLLKKHALQVR